MICVQTESGKTVGCNRRHTGRSNSLRGYHSPHCMSRPVSRFRDRSEDSDAALGWLLIYLTRPLPAAERRFGWALVQRWLSESVSRGPGVTL